MTTTLRLLHLAAVLVTLSACQNIGGAARPDAAASGRMLGQVASRLPGDYDNHEQAGRVRSQDEGVAAIAALHVQHALRLVEQARDTLSWEWRLQTETRPEPSIWLLRAQIAANGTVRVIPYRPVDPAAARTQFADTGAALRFEPAQWVQLDACTATGELSDDRLSAAANVESCSALLPGLGEDAALLPLRFVLAGDGIEAQTFADLPRGADAMEQARRVRWFSGWAAVNGGGPHATAANTDWHLQRDVRIGSEGGRVAVRWRDGTPSGYTLELERTSYPERKLAVLQLNVIEDASGKSLTYVWSDAQAHSIGVNLGWLQAGFVEVSAAPTH